MPALMPSYSRILLNESRIPDAGVSALNGSLYLLLISSLSVLPCNRGRFPQLAEAVSLRILGTWKCLLNEEAIIELEIA